MVVSRKVIVTGSSRGIGRSIATALVADGFEVITHSVRSGGTDLVFDIADRAATEAALTAWVEANGAPYGVVLNAGIADDAPFPGLEAEQWDRVLRTDLDGFYNVLKPLVLPMVQARQGGRIVVVSSVSGVMGNRGQTNYSAAKAGLIGAAKALSVELARRNITVAGRNRDGDDQGSFCGGSVEGDSDAPFRAARRGGVRCAFSPVGRRVLCDAAGHSS